MSYDFIIIFIWISIDWFDVAYTTYTLPTYDRHELSLNSTFRLALFSFYHLVYDNDEKKAKEIKANENK